MTPPPIVFERAALRHRRRRARAIGPATFLLDHVAGDLAERLLPVMRQFPLAADLGTPTDALRRVLAASGKVGRIVTVAEDLSAADLVADLEALPFRDGAFDLVVSGLALQYVNDLPGTLVQVRRALKPDGLFLAALVGGATLTELREVLAAAEAETTGGASPRVAPFVDVRDLGGLLQRAGFALPVTDVERLTVRYDTLIALMHDLRRMAATNVLLERRRVPLRRDTLARAGALYQARFADADGRIRATFEIVWLSGWAPHPRQQQPLRPGTAQRRLADALGVAEQRLPEPAAPRREPDGGSGAL